MTMAYDVEEEIARWRRHLERQRSLAPADVDELEAHLRDDIEHLEAAGLTPDEGFLVGVRRLGRVDELSREFAREHSDRLWKQLVLSDASAGGRSPGLLTAVLMAALAVKVPWVLGAPPDDILRFGGILVLAPLAGYFLLRTGASAPTAIGVGAVFAVSAGALALYPFAPHGQTVLLASIHAVVLLWLAAGIAYAAGDWRSERARMDFIRFTGEWVVYYALIALGGGVLAALTLGVFGALGADARTLVQDWLVPCGAAGSVVVAAWLVEAKQSVVENMAPILTKIFTPLFTILLLALAVTALVRWDLAAVDRDLLILLDGILVIVLGLLLYALSAREPAAAATWFDRLQLLMLVSALVVDVIVLFAIGSRIGAYGVTANKVAALGLNVVLLVNLVGAGVLQWRFVRGRIPVARLERWQTGYLPVFFAWCAAVVLVLPLVFAFG